MQEAQEEKQEAPKAGAKKGAKPSKAATSPKQVSDEPGKYPSKESIGPFCKSHLSLCSALPRILSGFLIYQNMRPANM
jgi:hypothetical protein